MTNLSKITLNFTDLQDFLGLGVAGNFAGHLEQAGEASDFANVASEVQAPKAIFPFYVPNAVDFLGTFPLSHQQIHFPVQQAGDHLQIEPEIALLCHIQYENQQVKKIIPYAFTAYNDCSIRRQGAKKICEKKNWGANSKGIASTAFAFAGFEKGSVIDYFRITSFHRHAGKLHAYGLDSRAVDYQYFHEKLLDWVLDKMNHQPDKDPMNDIHDLIQKAHYPTQLVLAIGATRYTPYGESHFLQVGDESIVVIYDERHYQPQQIAEMAQQNHFAENGVIALVQKVVG